MVPLIFGPRARLSDFLGTFSTEQSGGSEMRQSASDGSPENVEHLHHLTLSDLFVNKVICGNSCLGSRVSAVEY